MGFENQKIFIFGGSGSLGNKLISLYIHNNTIINYSRDECKHWEMELRYKTKNLHNVIGDIRDAARVKWALDMHNPTIIIIASALKHIDRCEYSTSECIHTNVIGVQNILNVIDPKIQSNLKTVCFISTDKACSPINTYGLCKALAEKIMVEKSYYVKTIKFVTVRYGNVLNSRGSIIPILHKTGLDKNCPEFKLTHPHTTRFVMTLEQSIDLIEHAITNADSGDIVIPKLISMNIQDLFEIFSKLYNKPVVITGLRPGEKLLESLINETQSLRLTKVGEYSHIKPPYLGMIFNSDAVDYNSKINPLTKDELYLYLRDLNLLEPDTC